MGSRGKKSIKPLSEKCIVDRLSPLPDDILHRILSFLDFLDVARTCVLSKRWRDVWMSVPCLNFDMNEWDFIKWALLLRDGSEIRRIHITFDEIEQLNWLLRFAASKKVQELSFIDGEPCEEELEFPRLLCKTLKSLTVHFKNEITIRVSTAFSSLKSLVLEGVVMSRDAAEKLLSSDCVELEDVYLEEIFVGDLEIINISARKLKNLTIKNICYCDGFTLARSFISKLNICAPNLVSFSYEGPMICGFAFLDTVSLQHISIRIPHIPSACEGLEDETFLPCPTRFIGLNHAKDLTLSSRVVKYFAPTYFDPLGITFILDNMNYLKLGLRRKVDYIEGLINLLKLSPNLEALAIRFTQVNVSFHSVVKNGTFFFDSHCPLRVFYFRFDSILGYNWRQREVLYCLVIFQHFDIQGV
ncbi:hypothetical protein ACJIZ3_007788 [Penstemon smallii]|uniref:F-box domain-containing protein n=1 Tax=Penstemon smallii TaxID=265156 RepID=A0ABD3T897_9LAMI